MSHRFMPLAVAHFLTTFNSNFMKNALVLLVVASMPLDKAEAMSSFVSAAFMLPMIFLSGLGGQLADRHGKAWMAKFLKGMELVAVAVALVGISRESYWIVLLGVILLQVVGSLFGPVRSSLIPALVPAGRIPSANAWIEGLSFVAMVAGLGFLGLVFSLEGVWRTLACAMVVAVGVGSFIAIRFVPQDDVGSPSVVVDGNLIKGTWRTLRGLVAEQSVLRPAIALGWSWFAASLALSTIPAMVARYDGGPAEMSGAMMAFGAVGTLSAQAAARTCGRLRRSWIMSAGFAALALGVGSVALALTGFGGNVVLVGGACIMAAAHSFVMIPAATAIQTGVPGERRARTSAGSNIVNAVFMVAGGMAVAAMQAVGVGLAAIYAACAVVSLAFSACCLAEARGVRRE